MDVEPRNIAMRICPVLKKEREEAVPHHNPEMNCKPGGCCRYGCVSGLAVANILGVMVEPGNLAKLGELLPFGLGSLVSFPNLKETAEEWRAGFLAFSSPRAQADGDA